VSDLVRVLVPAGRTLRDAMETMTRGGRQIALVVDGDRRLLGVITDGDARRALLRGLGLDAPVEDAMNPRPMTGPAGLAGAEALALMRQRGIRHLPLVDGAGRAAGLLLRDELLAPAAPLPALGVIMAGGQGRRLHPLTESTPKPLLRVGGIPLIDILVERLRQAGLVELVVAVHHKSAMIREHLGDGRRLGVRVDYVEEPAPLGTVGALGLLGGRLAAPAVVVNGDILTRCDFRAMWEFHRAQAGAAMTVGVSLHQVDLPYGEFTLRGDRVLRLEEKPRKEFPVNAGIYVIEPATAALIRPGEPCDATDLVRRCLDEGRPVAAYTIREYWLDVGRHPDLDKANRDVAEGLVG
jgi:dTDP-glucose pyrophosphorylase